MYTTTDYTKKASVDLKNALLTAKNLGANHWNKLRGSNIEDVVQAYLGEALQHPAVKPIRKEFPDNMDVARGYMYDVLRGSKNVPSIDDLPKASRVNNSLLTLLHKGSKAVGNETKVTRNARIGTGLVVGLPIASGLYTTHDNSNFKLSSLLKQDESNTIPIVAGAVAAGAPVVQGLHSGALALRNHTGKQFTNVSQLHKNLNPGDIVLVSSPGVAGGPWKPVISALGGDPYGYHVQNVTGKPHGSRKSVNFTHSNPGAGNAFPFNFKLSPEEDMIVRRFRSPELAKNYVDNLYKKEMSQEALEQLFGMRARGSMYEGSSSLKAGIKSLLPAPLSRLLKNNVSCGGGICSSLPAQASPIPLVPGVEPNDVLPHHIRRTNVLKTIGHYKAPRTGGQLALERLFQAAPWALRGGIGAGLGYAAYKGVKALTSDDTLRSKLQAYLP